MASTAAYEEMKGWLVENWGGTYPVLDFEYADEAYTQNETPFIVLEEATASEDIVAVAGIRPLVDEVAPFMVHLFFPSSSDRSAARALADQIVTKGRQYDFPDTSGRIRRVSPANPGLINDGLWNSMVVDIDYTLSRRPTIEREVYVP